MKNILKNILVIFLFLLTMTFIACKEKNIEISITGLDEVEVGTSITLVAKASNNDTKFVWESSNEKVATVDGGVVNGLEKGEVTISVSLESNSNVKATKKITVKENEANYVITLESEKISLVEGETKKIVASVTPESDLLWQSNSSSIATVDNGLIKALKKGVAIISVETIDGKAKKEIEVTVTEKIIEAGYSVDNLASDLKDTLDLYKQSTSVNLYKTINNDVFELVYNTNNGIFESLKYVTKLDNVTSSIYIKDGICYSSFENKKVKYQISEEENKALFNTINAIKFLESGSVSFYLENEFYQALEKQEEKENVILFKLNILKYQGESIKVEGFEEVLLHVTLDEGNVTKVDLILNPTAGIGLEKIVVEAEYRGTTNQEIIFPSDLSSYVEE